MSFENHNLFLSVRNLKNLFSKVGKNSSLHLSVNYHVWLIER